jgi:4'-phosphopantetheinyl transferase
LASPDEVLLFSADVRDSFAALGIEGPAELEATLHPSEVARADRFHFEKDRRRFVACRGLLRVLLGKLLSKAPARVRLDEGPHGKPMLRPNGKEGPQFNLSHSGERVLLAFSEDTLGVDLEEHRGDVEFLDVAKRFFSPDEAAYLREQPEPERAHTFFRFWSAKEAYLKALGTGFSLPSSCFTIRLEPRVELISRPDAPDEVGRWTLRELTVAPHFSAALATRQEGPLRAFGAGGAAH